MTLSSGLKGAKELGVSIFAIEWGAKRFPNHIIVAYSSDSDSDEYTLCEYPIFRQTHLDIFLDTGILMIDTRKSPVARVKSDKLAAG